MKIKNLFLSSLLSLFGFNYLYSQEIRDTTKTYEFPEIEITASYINTKEQEISRIEPRTSSFKTIYNNDLFKSLEGTTRIAPFISKPQVRSLTLDEFGGIWWKNIELIGPITQSLGLISNINENIMYVELLKNSSISYNNIGSSIELKPKKYEGNDLEIKAFTDFLNRTITLSNPIRGENVNGFTAVGLRNIYAPRIMEAFEILPFAMDFQSYSNLDINLLGKDIKIEAFTRNSKEYNNVNQSTDYGKLEVFQDYKQNLAILSLEVPFNGIKLAANLGYEDFVLFKDEDFGSLGNELDMKAKKREINFELSENNPKHDRYSVSATKSFIESDKSDDLELLRLWIRTKNEFGKFLFTFGTSLTRYNEQTEPGYEAILDYYLDNVKISLGHNYLINYLIHNDGYVVNLKNPQKSSNYFLSLEFKEEDEEIKFNFFKKHFTASYFRGKQEESRGNIYGSEIHLSGRNVFIDNLDNLVSLYFSQSEIDAHYLPGAFDFGMQIDLTYHDLLPGLNIVLQGDYKNGFYYNVKGTDIYLKAPYTLYLNFGLEKDFGNFNFALGIMDIPLFEHKNMVAFNKVPIYSRTYGNFGITYNFN